MIMNSLDIESFKRSVKESFQRVKRDVEEQKNRIKKLELKNNEINLLMQDILIQLKEIKEELKTISNKKNSKKEKKNAKEAYDKIISLLNEGPVSIISLKEIIVDKEKICSKATFYRYIKRLIDNKKVAVIEDKENKFLVLA